MCCPNARSPECVGPTTDRIIRMTNSGNGGISPSLRTPSSEAEVSGMNIPSTMSAVLLHGHGGFDQLEHRSDVPVPQPASDEVLIRVAAAGVNNTDINTRIGWYSKAVSGSTDAGSDGFGDDIGAGDWSGEGLKFPLIQGADIAGYVEAVGRDVNSNRIGERVIARSMQNIDANDPTACITLGSEMNGGFAQYCVVRADMACRVDTDLTDVELGSLPCAYSTAEGLLERIGLRSGQRVLVTGASGGVGSAAIQLARARGASVVAVAAQSKVNELIELGADAVVPRGADLVETLGTESVDAVADLVAGPQWPSLLEVLKKQGCYGTSGAIAGPIVELDVRTLYLKDLTLVGSTYQTTQVFQNLIDHIESGAVRPLVAQTFPLSDIVAAQKKFLAKDFVGKLVLIP